MLDLFVKLGEAWPFVCGIAFVVFTVIAYLVKQNRHVLLQDERWARQDELNDVHSVRLSQLEDTQQDQWLEVRERLARIETMLIYVQRGMNDK